MATRAAIATGNFTAAGTWAEVDATSLLAPASPTNQAFTTSYLTSSTFTPGAITIDGIAIWVNTRPGSTGTISVALDQATVTEPGTEVTIDVADIPAAGQCWVFFKFAAPVLLTAATAYGVKVKTSNASQVNGYRDGTTNNWARLLRTTTTGAPAASENLYVIGEKTGQGTGNAITVTMDNTAALDVGLIDHSSGGSLLYGVAAATAYYLGLAGNLNIRSGGEFNIGRKTNRIPSDSSAELKFVNATNVDRGIEMFGSGILRSGGAVITNPWALLNADAAAAATSLATDISTGWKNGDLIGLASTTRTASEAESKSLTADAVGTGLTIAALTNAHGGNGTSLVQAELINLTRNVKIHGTSATLQAYINTEAASVTELEATEIYWMGSGTTNKRGIDIGSTTGSFYAEYCAIRDFVVSTSMGMNLKNSSVNNVSVKHCVFYNTNYPAFYFQDSGQNNIVIDDCVAMRVPGWDVARLHLAQQVSNLRVSGSQNGTGLTTVGATYNGAFSNINSHSNSSVGWGMPGFVAGTNNTISGITVWRNNGGGWQFDGGTLINMNFDTITLFGNSTNNVTQNSVLRNVTIKNFTIRAGVTLTTANGWRIAAQSSGVWFVNGTFGVGEAHTTCDFTIGNSETLLWEFHLDNVTMNSATQIQNFSNSLAVANGKPVSMIRANFLGQALNHKTWLGNGTWSYDTAISEVSPSLRLTPLSATTKLQSSGFFKKVPNGEDVTFSIKVRKSVSGDGAAYNGSQPRLIVRRNYGAGITADTILDTATAAADGAFETLSGTTAAVTANCALEFFVDCDGTAGWVNVDTLSAS